MAHKTETPVIIVLCVCVYIYTKLCRKSVLSCPENVMKIFTVWSSMAGAVVLVLSTVGLRGSQRGIAQPSREGTGTPGPPCLFLATFSYPTHLCSSLCISHRRQLHCNEVHLRTFPFTSAVVNLSLRLYIQIFQQ